MAGSESYPEDLRYHPEHDWARIEGDEAVLGITWWAQDALGELVHFEAPAVGGSTVKDEAYGEVESVKAVSDVISPLSGEILEVNEKVVDEPETVNDDPYGEGWLVRIRLSDPAEVDEPPRRRGVPGGRSRAMTAGYLSLTDRDRDEMLAAIGVSSIDELFAQIPAGVRFDRELDVPPALPELALLRHFEELAAKNAHNGRRALVPRRGHLRPSRAGDRRPDPPARRVPHRVHAVPAGDEPGRPAGDLRVPDGDLRADRDGRVERIRATTGSRSRPTRASSRSTSPGAPASCLRRH